MLSKSAARNFFLLGTFLCFGVFVMLTVDTISKVPAQTNAQNITDAVKRGKMLFDSNNCMGCHTILGEGAYYAPDLTKSYTQKGKTFIKAMLTDPEAIYPGRRKMVKYNFSEEEKEDLVAFLKWISEMDLNGFPPKPGIN
ncbi:MAG: cytochrome c [Bdellovibrionales bacterium]|jgi:nitric oxide reductase subunit C|nr:cytochrome c [Bdellovibrionales bacterium]MBT3525762.1 cytochrome c [Bdellovibrionales bacterium]MBT7668947.1 cytochrome c [Bdellovibrionales bacterium]MBT7768150.1 cytochrome c [Bdellovibrionales bacterium]